VVPMMAPVDHTFRAYEPELSFYSVNVFAQVNLDKATIMTSNLDVKAENIGSSIVVKGRTGEAMSH
jgi:hypothetical protein